MSYKTVDSLFTKIKLNYPFHQRKAGFFLFMVFASYNFMAYQFLAVNFNRAFEYVDVKNLVMRYIFGAVAPKNRSLAEFDVRKDNVIKNYLFFF